MPSSLKEYDPSLIDLVRQLSAMDPICREAAVLAVQDREKIMACLSEVAPFSLVQMFAGRAQEVGELIESQFSDYEKGRLAYSQNRVEEAKRLFIKAAKDGDLRAYYNLGIIAGREGKIKVAESYYKIAASMGDPDAFCNLVIIEEKRSKAREEKQLLRQTMEMEDEEPPEYFGRFSKN